MNFKKTFQILSKDIEEIEKILGEIDISSPESRMEMKLALSKLKNLQENFGLFSTLLEEVAVVPSPPPAEKAAQAPASPEASLPKKENSAPEAASPPPEQPDREETAEPVTHIIPEPEEAVIQEEMIAEEKEEVIPVNPETQRKVVAEEPPAKGTAPKGQGRKVLSDTLHPQHGYRNEQLGREHPGGDLSSRISKSAITDLRKVINLNEKFMFIRDLFGGDKDRYEETIRLLNKAQNSREVEDLLQAFQWDAKSEAARTFREKVERKLKSLKNG